MKSGKGCDYKVILQPDGNIRYEKAKPLTWNERINQMTVEERAQWMLIEFPKFHKKAYDYAWKNRKTGEFSRYYRQRMSELLTTPCEGEEKG